MKVITKDSLSKEGISVHHLQSSKEINGITVYVQDVGSEDIDAESWLYYTWDVFKAIEFVLKIHNRFPTAGETLSVATEDSSSYFIETVDHHVWVTDESEQYSMSFMTVDYYKRNKK